MKKGILAVSFGTSHIDTMEKTIDVLEKEFAKTFEEAVVYRAFTSNMIIKKLKRTAKNGGRWDRRSYRSADSCDQRDRK